MYMQFCCRIVGFSLIDAIIHSHEVYKTLSAYIYLKQLQEKP